MEEIRIQLLFEKDGFRDALYFTPEEFESLTDKQKEDAKQARFDKWAEAKENPPVEEEKPVEEVVASLDEQIEALQAQKEELLTSKEA